MNIRTALCPLATVSLLCPTTDTSTLTFRYGAAEHAGRLAGRLLFLVSKHADSAFMYAT